MWENINYTEIPIYNFENQNLLRILCTYGKKEYNIESRHMWENINFIQITIYNFDHLNLLRILCTHSKKRVYV